MSRVPENGAAGEIEESLNNNVFVREVLKNQVEALRKQNALAREILEVLRDLRDELAHLRDARKKADASAHGR